MDLPPSYIDSHMIRVLVGDEQDCKEFNIYQDLISPRNNFFKNALKKLWREAEERKVTAAWGEPETFSLYMKLLYVSAAIRVTKLYLHILPQFNKLPIYEAA